jgi:hypothetical protein
MRQTCASRASPRLDLGVPIVRPHGPWRGAPTNSMCHRARETGRHQYSVPHPMPPKGVGFPDPLSGTLKEMGEEGRGPWIFPLSPTESTVCHERADERRCGAVQEMEVGPPEPAVRGRLQTTGMCG